MIFNFKINHAKEIELFKEHLKKINLKVTSQRLKVLEAF